LSKGDNTVLKFENRWRFTPPEDGDLLRKSIPSEAIDEFFGLIKTVATQGDRQTVFEQFKSLFSTACNRSYCQSSSAGWAQSDLESMLHEAAGNAPKFIEAYYDSCEGVRHRHADWVIPDTDMINLILERHRVGFVIDPPHLIARGSSGLLVEVPSRPPTLAEQSADIFQKSIQRSTQLLNEGQNREAVQELLWLLESVTTAFRGVETVSGKIEGGYFNQIVRDLRAKNRGTTLDRVAEWTTALHGYLSSPTGGGVRHGLDLQSGIQMGPREARLFANLVRSYLSYFLEEHEAMIVNSRGDFP
jgi:hypothetical protein